MKVIKRTLAGIVLVFILIISAGVIFSMVYKDKIVGYFLNEANKYITTPIDVAEIEVSILNHFPNISVNLHNVSVKESDNNHKGILGTARVISAAFNPIDLLNKKYTIKGIHISNAKINLKIDKNGNPNYLFYKKDSAAKGSLLELRNITGENLTIDYLDQKSNYHIAFYVKNVNSN